MQRNNECARQTPRRRNRNQQRQVQQRVAPPRQPRPTEHIVTIRNRQIWHVLKVTATRLLRVRRRRRRVRAVAEQERPIGSRELVGSAVGSVQELPLSTAVTPVREHSATDMSYAAASEQWQAAMCSVSKTTTLAVRQDVLRRETWFPIQVEGPDVIAGLSNSRSLREQQAQSPLMAQ
ncbi:hypothetical protein GJ496_005107 [Pomphorhynchus laevis]|nr:hypothetical protein GJ496_005107 [Pomphorhynchus laevis]